MSMKLYYEEETFCAPNDDGRTFHRFSRLPKEVQLRIWKFALWPRRVTVKRRRTASYQKRFYSPEGVPAVMHTCQDSRREAAYTRAFENTSHGRYIWVNYQLDTIHMNDGLLRAIDAKDLGEIRKVVFEIPHSEGFVYFELDHLMTMRSVEDVVMLATEDEVFLVSALPSISEQFEASFEEVEGWKCPNLRVVIKATGEVMNMQNYRAVLRYLDRYGRSFGNNQSRRGSFRRQ